MAFAFSSSRRGNHDERGGENAQGVRTYVGRDDRTASARSTLRSCAWRCVREILRLLDTFHRGIAKGFACVSRSILTSICARYTHGGEEITVPRKNS